MNRCITNKFLRRKIFSDKMQIDYTMRNSDLTCRDACSQDMNIWKECAKFVPERCEQI